MSELSASDATVSGEARRIPASEKQGAVLVAGPALVTAQITIKRAATGVEEHYTLTGTVPAESGD